MPWAAAIGAVGTLGGAAISGAMSGGSSGGGGGGGGGSLGQGLGDILSGGLSAALGLQGLTGGNLNQLQAGAAAANPFGQYASGFVPMLQQLLGSGSGSMANMAELQAMSEQSFLQALEPSAHIGTDIGALTGAANISTPTQTGQLAALTNNPTQLISALQGGGIQTPAGITTLANQNPAALTAGQQFQYGQGLDALNRSLAQTGQVGSGNQYAAATQYGQNFASQAYQQNVQNALAAQQSIGQTAGVNQGLQGLVNQMGQNQFANVGSLAQLLGNQQQQTFGNILGSQQLQSQQQQNTQTNLSNLLSQLVGINSTGLNFQMGLLGPLLTATQASSSSPATAGGILSNLGVAQQNSAGNIASGLSGIGSGIGQLLGGINFGSSGGYSPNASLFGPTGGYGSNPFSGYYSGGGNTYGFSGGGTTGNAYGFTM